MDDHHAVVFREGSAAEAAGALEVVSDRLLLHGRASDTRLELEVRFSDLAEVRVGRRPNERINGYATLVLERTTQPPVQVAPLGVALLPEIASLLTTLTQRAGGDVLAVRVPLKHGCLDRARELIAQGPPVDPSSLGLSGHEVHLREGEAIFVFRGSNVRERIGQAIRQPPVWRAGLAWRRCFAGPPQIVESEELPPDADPAYRWVAAE
jgi:hypothetical protein